MRSIFAKWLTEKAKEDDSIYLVVGDIGFQYFDEFIAYHPDRFINMGLCEQSMIGIAAGMALSGLKPYCFSIIPFVLERPYEAIKIGVVANQANVKILGYWDYPTLGITHQTKYPKEICKSLEIDYKEPNNLNECEIMLNETYGNNKPCFFYLTKE